MSFRLVVATWNLWGLAAPGTYTRDRKIIRGALPGSPASRELDPLVTWQHRRQLLVAELAALGCDLVVLQENGRLVAGTTQAQQLASELGLELAEDAHERGLAALSGGAVRAARPLELDTDLHGYPPPYAVTAKLRGRDVTVVAVHLPLERFGDREPIIRSLIVRLSDDRAPLLVCGDLNLQPDHPSLELLLDAGYVDASRAIRATMPNPDPEVRPDYVLVRADSLAAILSAATLGSGSDADGFLPSDHLGIAVELELR
jgi:endonuclease/exonuclease/phosphatase family metal-dependent hydrolase